MSTNHWRNEAMRLSTERDAARARAEKLEKYLDEILTNIEAHPVKHAGRVELRTVQFSDAEISRWRAALATDKVETCKCYGRDPFGLCQKCTPADTEAPPTDASPFSHCQHGVYRVANGCKQCSEDDCVWCGAKFPRKSGDDICKACRFAHNFGMKQAGQSAVEWRERAEAAEQRIAQEIDYYEGRDARLMKELVEAERARDELKAQVIKVLKANDEHTAELIAARDMMTTSRDFWKDEADKQHHRAEERNDECNRIQRVLNLCAEERDQLRAQLAAIREQVKAYDNIDASAFDVFSEIRRVVSAEAGEVSRG